MGVGRFPFLGTFFSVPSLIPNLVLSSYAVLCKSFANTLFDNFVTLPWWKA
jgi:hypothetical protein